MTFPPHWAVGGVAVLVVGAAIVGLVAMVTYNILRPAFFRGEVLNKNTPTLVPEATGVPAGFPPQIGRADVPPDMPLVPPEFDTPTGPNPVRGSTRRSTNRCWELRSASAGGDP